MNLKEYISSGVLETYVTGGLTDAERADVEANLIRHPELREELRIIEETNEKVLSRAAIAVPSELKQKISERVNRETRIVQLPASGLQIWKWAAAASIAVAVVATFFAFEYRARWQKAAQLALDTKAQYESMASNYNKVKQIEDELHIAADPSMKKVVMRGTNNAPEAMATVYWGETSEHVYLKVNQMKELDQNSQYQLWAIIDGKPVDAGVFDASTSGMIRMKNIAKGASTFAVTIEKRGGNPTPTMNTMQVAGNV